MIIGAAGGGLGAMAGAMGTGVLGGVLMTKGDDIRLNPGTILRIRFERDLALPVFPTSSSPVDGPPQLSTPLPTPSPEANHRRGRD